MATIKDIGVAAAINILSAFIFLVAFAILRLQPFNDRVYFPKWYLKGLRSDPAHSGAYIRFLNWMPDALRMPEPELIDHAGLDSAVYLRIYLIGYVANVVKFFLEECLCESVVCNIIIVLILCNHSCRLKIFVPIAFLAWAMLLPVNWTNSTLELAKLNNVTSSDIDKLSISNIPVKSQRFETLFPC